MRESTFTPPPWVDVDDEVSVHDAEGCLGSAVLIQTQDRKLNQGETPVFVCAVFGLDGQAFESNMGDCGKNVALIKQAPNLASSLVELLGILEDDMADDSEPLNLWRRAIRNARKVLTDAGVKL